MSIFFNLSGLNARQFFSELLVAVYALHHLLLSTCSISTAISSQFSAVSAMNKCTSVRIKVLNYALVNETRKRIVK